MEPYFMVIAIAAVLTTLATVAVYERMLAESRTKISDLEYDLDLSTWLTASLSEENVRLRGQLAAISRHPSRAHLRLVDES